MISTKLDWVNIVGSILTKEEINVYLRKYLENTHWVNTGENKFALIYFDSNLNKNIVKANFLKNEYHSTYRLSTSNHLNDNQILEVQKLLSVMQNLKITRVDIAIDLINEKDSLLEYNFYSNSMKETLYYKVFTSRDKTIETKYYGKRTSQRMFKIYNKYIEQKSKNIDKNILTWHRAELTLKYNKISTWEIEFNNILNNLKKPIYDKTINTPNEVALLYAIDNNIISINDFSKAKKAKLKKLQLQNNDTDLIKNMKLQFENDIPKIKEELNHFIKEISVNKPLILDEINSERIEF